MVKSTYIIYFQNCVCLYNNLEIKLFKERNMIYSNALSGLNIKISPFAMGCMRLPLESEGIVDKAESIRMIRYAIDEGVTYIDTAYDYHNGTSEIIVGEALKDGYRLKTNLATKLPTHLIKNYRELEKYLDEQLKRLRTDHIDIYLLNSLNKENWDNCKRNNILEFLDRMVEKGKIIVPGFSFHDDFSLFKEIISSYDFKMCQIPLNYLDKDYHAGMSGLKLANELDIPVVIMEPLKGGKLAKEVPGVKKVWEENGFSYDPVMLGFRWVLSNGKVTSVLSDVHRMKELEEDLEIFNLLDRSPLTKEENEMYEKTREVLFSKIKVNCTSCGYCMPCPNNVNIPGIFTQYNGAFVFEDVNFFSGLYKTLIKEGESINCLECGRCERLCPQKIHIRDSLKKAHEFLIK